jgi:DNA-binding transcriptional MerR regulator
MAGTARRNFNTFVTYMGQSAVNIPEKLYFKIGEVCDLVGVQAHVLRYWETEFPQLAPQKNRSGQRSYRRKDVEISLRIKELLYDDMYTIAGARKKLQIELREPPKLKIVPRETPEEPVPQDHQTDGDTPGLFDGELELESFEPEQPETVGVSITDTQRDGLKTIASQLLELRELLRSGRSE